jgi:hypothetical protein
MYSDEDELEYDDSWDEEPFDEHEDFSDFDDYNYYNDLDEAEHSGLDMYREIGATMPKKSFTLQEAIEIGQTLGINWETSPFTPEQFRMGLDVELEHGRRDPETNVTRDDPILTGKIALAHLREFPDYYDRLKMIEQ